MITIQNCTKCELCNNQKPLLEPSTALRKSIFFVGLSAVKVKSIEDEVPFSTSTRSGNLLRIIPENSISDSIYYTNIVKCLPLSGKKIRYPTLCEMNTCFSNFQLEMEQLNPKKIVLFGKKVSSFVIEKLCNEATLNYISDGFIEILHEGREILSAPHPSYMLVYRRKFLDDYIKTIRSFTDR